MSAKNFMSYGDAETVFTAMANAIKNNEDAVAAVTSALTAIKDGTDIDSFGDVEVALLDKADTSDLGTAAAKDSTNSVTSGSTDLVESGAVKDAIDTAVAAAYHPAGTKTVAQLTHDLLIAANEGNVYNITDSGTTTSDFIEGIGKQINEGSNVGICKVGNDYKFDLLSGFIDTTNFVQKSATAGLLKNDGTVNDEIEGDVDSLKSGLTNLDTEVNGDATVYPYADVITIPDAVPSNLADCNVKIEPVQDLHGYDHPWIGGAGKNKLPMVLADIKSNNTSGTWSGNAYTLNDVTFTVNTDDDGNVVGIVANGTASANVDLLLNDYSTYLATSYSMSGCPTGGSESTYCLIAGTSSTRLATDTGSSSGFTLAEETSLRSAIRIFSGYTATNLTFYPMIRLSTETDATFAPYTNICPISGHTEASVQRDGANIFDPINVETFDATGQGVMRYGHRYNTGTYTVVNNMASESIFVRQVKNDLSEYGQYSTISALNHSTINVNDGYMLYVYYQSLTEEQRKNVCVNKGNDTTFEPYQGKTYTIALGDTIYGGTVDFDSGVMTVTHGIIVVRYNNTDGEAALSNNITRFRVVLSTQIIPGGANSVCSHFQYLESWDAPTPHFYTQAPYAYCFAPGNGAQEVKAYIEEQYNAGKPITICSKLENTFTVQLTPQQIQLLKGQNTLTASTGDISVTVNGVSGSIGSVQEQVNDHEERIEAVESGLIKHYNDTANFNITTQSGALYRSSLVTMELPEAPQYVLAHVSGSYGNVVGAFVHSISGKYVNVIVWATESIELSNARIDFLYS